MHLSELLTKPLLEIDPEMITSPSYGSGVVLSSTFFTLFLAEF